MTEFPRLSACQQRTWALIQRCARDGLPAPTMRAIAKHACAGDGRQQLKCLTARGLIAVEVMRARRRIHILQGEYAGRATDWTKRPGKTESKPGSETPGTMRACITCGTKFLSEGAHNRMCASCRTNDADEPCRVWAP